MRTFTLSLAALATAGTALLAGCSSEPADEPAPTAGATASETPSASAAPTPPATTSASTPASTPVPAGPRLEVSIHGKTVLPNAQTISIKAGRPLTVSVESDRAGELHVHAKPEQYVEFEEGVSEHRLVIKTPGSVEIEEHETGAVVALLTVEK